MNDRIGGAGQGRGEGRMQRSNAPVRVLVVAANEEIRAQIVVALRRPGLSVVDAVGEATAAVRACRELSPDVAVVDAAAGAEAGFAAVQEIMAFRPTPILVVTDAPEGQEAFQALALGALDVMGRPNGAAAEGFGEDLAHRLRLLSGVQVITHVRGRRARKREADGVDGPPVLGIAASLGGPRALAVLLKGLPRDFPAPVLLVQHISHGFSLGLASWLASESGLSVKEAVDGERLLAGRVYVAPTGAHLMVGPNDDVALDAGPSVEGFRPSATALFASLARRYGPRVIAVVLTGMGRDGAEGLSQIRAAGGRTIAQDEATSVVYGMPRAAVEAGAIERILPLEEIAPAVVGLVRLADAAGWGI